MAIRALTLADLPLLRVLLGAVTNPPYYPADDDLAAVFIESPTEVARLDDVDNLFCSVAVMPERKEMSVRWLLPRVEFDVGQMAKLGRVLAACILEAIARYPDSETEDWVIWAEFMDGRNALGVADGGLELCTRWRMVFRRGATRANLTLTDRVEQGLQVWRIWWTVRPVKLVAATL